jgi:hypothetical protein
MSVITFIWPAILLVVVIAAFISGLQYDKEEHVKFLSTVKKYTDAGYTLDLVRPESFPWHWQWRITKQGHTKNASVKFQSWGDRKKTLIQWAQYYSINNN